MLMVIYSELGGKATAKKVFNGTIDMSSRAVRILVKDFYKMGLDDEVLKLLQTFNKSIVAFDSEAEQYKVSYKGEVHRLGLHRLSTGEKVFVISYIVDKVKTHIAIGRSFGEISLPYVQSFFNLWKDSPYIDVVVSDGMRQGFISAIARECGVCIAGGRVIC